MDHATLIGRLVEPSLTAMGYDLVRVQLTGGDTPTLQIMAERCDRDQMTVDDCADISRNISALLDAEDPISGTYNLEVSSPGIDRPLVRLDDFDRFAGFEARIECHDLVDGRKRFRGTLAGVEGDAIRIAVEGQEYRVPFDGVRKAKLILTDELIAASQNAGNA